MIHISSSVHIDENELHFDPIRASGPGGQNVNKVSTSVQLRFDIRASAALPQDVKERLIKLAGVRVTEDGILIIEAKRHRTQEQNRLDAVQRLTAWIQKALVKPKLRKPTRPGTAVRAARIGSKKKRGELKRLRHLTPDDWD